MLFLGIVIGALFVGLTVLYLMRNHMVSEIPVPGNMEQTCQALEEAVKAVKGWGQPIPPWEIYKSQVSKHLTYDNIVDMKIYFVCKSPYANKILRKFPSMGAMMPCSWAVYQTTNGKTYLAKLNIGLMSKMFFGNVIGSVMGQAAREEKQILKELLKRLESPKQAETKEAVS